MSVSYRIIPWVTDSGTPMFQLYRDWDLNLGLFGYHAGSKLFAINADHEVLERAAEHLKNTPAIQVP